MDTRKILLCLGFAALAATAGYAAEGTRAPTVYVVVDGTLDGTKSDELPGIFVEEMGQAPASAWRFVPVSSSEPLPPNRIEWHLKFDADAAGTVRTYGFSRAMMARLIGSNRGIALEARLYINNAIQGTVFGAFRYNGNPRDQEFATEVSMLSRQLMSQADFDPATHQFRS